MATSSRTAPQVGRLVRKARSRLGLRVGMLSECCFPTLANHVVNAQQAWKSDDECNAAVKTVGWFNVMHHYRWDLLVLQLSFAFTVTNSDTNGKWVAPGAFLVTNSNGL